MPETRIYSASPLVGEARIALPPAAAHHVARVLRLREGDAVTLFDGAGGEYPARIAAIVRDTVMVDTGAHRAAERESPLRITLAQALQAADKMDYTIRKAVELGAARIVPLAARRSVLRLDGERAAKRLLHWRQVVVAACEQCGRNRPPEVAPVQALDAWLGESSPASLRLLLSPAGEAGLGALELGDGGAAGGGIELLAGPEGGFEEAEERAARYAGFRPLRLGPRVLRTETAGLAALAALQARWGDFA